MGDVVEEEATDCHVTEVLAARRPVAAALRWAVERRVRRLQRPRDEGDETIAVGGEALVLATALFRSNLDEQTRKFFIDLLTEVEQATLSFARERIAQIDLPSQKLVVLKRVINDQ